MFFRESVWFFVGAKMSFTVLFNGKGVEFAFSTEGLRFGDLKDDF